MENKKTVYVSGHRNPDSDSICSAIAYAELKNLMGEYNAVPIRIGDINRETQFILDYFDIDPPILKTTMKPQILDIDIDRANIVSKDISLYKALELIKEHNAQNLQIVDEEEKLIGVVTLSNLTNAYLDIWDDSILGRAETPLINIEEVLRAKEVFKPENHRELSGRMRVFAADPNDIDDTISKDDIVIVAGREESQKKAIERKVSILIVTMGALVSDEVLKLAKENDVTVLSTKLDSFLAARLLPLSLPISYVMKSDDLIYFNQNDYIDEIKDIMTKTRYRAYPVVDNNKKVVGSIARYHLITSEKKPLIMVDHNERNQAVEDIEYAEILEIIDHHRVANIATNQPVFFRNMPVGSTATIVSSMYLEQGIRPSRQIAGILASAIISDTLLLSSPTTTAEDARILEIMSKIAGIDKDAYAVEMFKAGTSLDGKSAEDLLTGDVKSFEIESENVRIAQVFTMDLESISSIQDELVKEMESETSKNKISTFVLVLTDIIKETSEIIITGKYKDQIARAFNSEIKDGKFTAKGVLSRKKQVVPTITDAISEAKN